MIVIPEGMVKVMQMRHDGDFRRYSGTPRTSLEEILSLNKNAVDQFGNEEELQKLMKRKLLELQGHIIGNDGVVTFPVDDKPYPFFIDVWNDDINRVVNKITVLCYAITKQLAAIKGARGDFFYIGFGNVASIQVEEITKARKYWYIGSLFSEIRDDLLESRDVKVSSLLKAIGSIDDATDWRVTLHQVPFPEPAISSMIEPLIEEDRDMGSLNFLPRELALGPYREKSTRYQDNFHASADPRARSS